MSFFGEDSVVETIQDLIKLAKHCLTEIDRVIAITVNAAAPE